MGGSIHTDRVIAEIADRQLGVVARWQLRAAGISERQIDRRIANKHLRPLYPGVYAVGHRVLVQEALWAAALLACGDGAVLCRRTAAALWGFHDDVAPVEIAGPGQRGGQLDGIAPCRLTYADDEVTRHKGLPTTTPARTLVDLAGVLQPHELRRAVERAQDVDRFDHRRLAIATERHRRRPGVRLLVDAVNVTSPDADGAKSHLERLFLTLIRQAKLPRPQVNAVVSGRRRDFYWPDHSLVVETDGYRWHKSRDAMRTDRRRDRELLATGIRTIRFTYEEVVFDPQAVVSELSGLLQLQI